MIKYVCAVLMMLLIGSCDQQSASNTGADHYRFSQKQYEKDSVLIDVTVFKTQAELIAAAKDHLKGTTVNPANVVAFSVLQPPTFDVCHIYMIDPAYRYEPEFVGHEFLHCIYGQWHIDNNTH